MTEAERQEMRTIYRDAADKTAQLGILVDMYQVSVEEAAEVCGCEVPAALQRFKPVRLGQKAPRGARIPPEEKRQAVAEVMAGKPAVEIADRFGVQVTAVKSWVRQAKRAGQEEREVVKTETQERADRELQTAQRRTEQALKTAQEKVAAEAACARLEAEKTELTEANAELKAENERLRTALVEMTMRFVGC